MQNLHWIIEPSDVAHEIIVLRYMVYVVVLYIVVLTKREEQTVRHLISG